MIKTSNLQNCILNLYTSDYFTINNVAIKLQVNPLHKMLCNIY